MFNIQLDSNYAYDQIEMSVICRKIEQSVRRVYSLTAWIGQSYC